MGKVASHIFSKETCFQVLTNWAINICLWLRAGMNSVRKERFISGIASSNVGLYGEELFLWVSTLLTF